ncbi:hypothetical protein Tco_0491818 [Tanacetum coccineum]
MEQPQSSSSQHIKTANELVPLDYQVAIERCNNKTTLPKIPCPKECRITVKQVPNANDTIRFMGLKQWVWKSVRYGVSKELDMAYWGFLGVGTTLDIFQNIIFIPYLEYGVLSLSGYGVLSFILCGLW